MNIKLEKIIFNFLNEKSFIIKETPYYYYFLENENDEYSQIRIKKNNMICYVNYDSLEEIELFFSITYAESKDVLTRYIENTLNIKVSNTPIYGTLCLPIC